MDYNTLKNILYNMPETYEEAAKINQPMAQIIQQEVLLDNLIKHGIFENKEDYLNKCQEKYIELREETIRQLEEFEENDN